MLYIHLLTTFHDYNKKELLEEFKKLPIKLTENQAPFIEKVTQILALKKEDPKADTSQLEAEIDRMVYALYELTEEEIQLIEAK